MDYIEIIASLAALLILGTIVVLIIAMIRVVPADIPTVLREAGSILCRFMELLLPGRSGGSHLEAETGEHSSTSGDDPQSSRSEAVDHP